MAACILKVSGLKKSFVGVMALRGMDLEVKKGEVFCLAGENGCGKSTLIKCVSGIYTPDAGSIEIDGKEYAKLSPIEAIKMGIQVIYQDLSVFPNLTVMENLAFNTELRNNKKIVNYKRFREIAARALDTIHYDLPLDTVVGDLPIAQKQLIAIARALVNDARLIIMDEPTTALTQNEVKVLFDIIRELKKLDVSVLFVGHKLNELFQIADRCAIMRNGAAVWTGDIKDIDAKSFSYHMTGRDVAAVPYRLDSAPAETLLEVRSLTLEDKYRDISFDLKAGEILGVTGLLGSGRTELALTLFGLLRYDSGEIYIKGKSARIRSVQDAMRYKIGYVPENRLTEGLFLNQSIGRNIVISKLTDFTSCGFLQKAKLSGCIREWVDKLSIATPNPNNYVSTLSGGNQQRVVLAKWIARDLDILILNSPTVGVDVGAKFDIHGIVKELAQSGLGVIVISDDLPEVMSICSKILIMKKGAMTPVFPTSQSTEAELEQRIMSETAASEE